MHPGPSPFRLGKSGDRGVSVSRGFASPGQRILRAHIDPNILPRWLGTPQAPLTVRHVDPRPGGRFNLAATRPDATRPDAIGLTVSGQFVDLTETRIRLEARSGRDAAPDAAASPIQITIEIQAEAHGTRLALSLRFADRATRDATLNGPPARWIGSAYTRLDALLQD